MARHSIRKEVRAATRAKVTEKHWYNRGINILKRLLLIEGLTEEDKEHTVLVNKLTNWQRNQWARAGYPDDLQIITDFTLLTKEKNNA